MEEETHEAVAVLRPAADATAATAWKKKRAPMLLTCEHASVRIPPAWPHGWPPADARIVGTHWSIDRGAEELTRELAARRHGRTTAAATQSRAVIARFSRLLCDCNRPLTADTLFRTVADGLPIALNQDLTDEDRKRRLALLYEPYHAAVDAELRAQPVELVFSIHSYTDLYEGRKRDVEVGLLFNESDELAAPIMEALRGLGYDARLNEPWSGKEGFMFAAEWHARDHGTRSLMIEVRQDLLVQAEWRARFLAHLLEIMKRLGLY